MTDEHIKLAEEHQERMCDLCERHILGCKHSTSTFLCEGSRCEDAMDYLIEALEQDRLDEYDVKKYLLLA
jgi:hypothetical protein